MVSLCLPKFLCQPSLLLFSFLKPIPFDTLVPSKTSFRIYRRQVPRFMLMRPEILDVEPLMRVLWVDPPRVVAWGSYLAACRAGFYCSEHRGDNQQPPEPADGAWFRKERGWLREEPCSDEGGEVRGAALQPGARAGGLMRTSTGGVFQSEDSEYDE